MYKLTHIPLEAIESPIILIMPDETDGTDETVCSGRQQKKQAQRKQQTLFRDGAELAENQFDKKYLINTVRAREEGMIEISLSVTEVERAQTANKAADNSANSVSFF